MRWQVLAMANGIRSLANPGSTPEMKRLELPCCAACFDGRDVLVGHDAPRILEHPGRRPDEVDACGQDAQDVGDRLGYPVVAHRAVHGAVGFGRPAVRPDRWSRRCPSRSSSPASSPASLPTLASDETQTPVSSKRGSLIRWLSAIRPRIARADMCDADRHCCLLKAAAGQLSNLSDATRGEQGRSWACAAIPAGARYPGSAGVPDSCPALQLAPLQL